MKVQDLLKQYKGLYYNESSFETMMLTIVDNSEVRSMLDSKGLNVRAFTQMTSGNLLVGRKCLEVRVPYDVWYDRCEHVTDVPDLSGVTEKVTAGDMYVADYPTEKVTAGDMYVADYPTEIARLRMWVRALAVAGIHAFDPNQRYHSAQVLNEINEDDS